MSNEIYGWTNRPTWWTVSYIDNDYYAYHEICVLARHCDVDELAEKIRLFILGLSSEILYGDYGIYENESQFDDVNWIEIAESYKED